MISSKLKQHFIQKKVQKLLANQESFSSAKKDKKIRSVGILTQESFFTEYDLSAEVTNQLKIQNPKIYSFRNFEKHHEKSYKHFSEKDFNWKGAILEPSFKSFVEEPLDLLICYYSKSHSLLDYVSLLSNASFKIGFAGVHHQFYDIEIAVQPDAVNDFFVETHKYLGILGKL